MTTYQVTTAAAVVRDNSGAQHMFYEKAVFDDGNFSAEHVKMLAKEGFIKKFTAPEPDVAPEPPSDRVEDILASVGDDKEKAAAALEQEKAGKNRKTLVEPLEKILSA